MDEATRLVNLCLDAGVNLFDTAAVLIEQRHARELLLENTRQLNILLKR